ncbi:Transcription factor Dp [Hondaea fermentalgiana]|uniref:Transcription factor Dp n=1 Tax=Hondaea fermentalgiana TaxID=2315210 RepID=A0A2R5GIY6_9STRA|nr:Transcription factor Dp [Hondaea fermentalgiana]|eukprot:GBG28251.1 Transcription factor Dp [Hondaea fermentalgiana]
MMSTLLGKEAPEDEDTAAKQGEAAHAQSQRKRRREIVTGQSGSVRKEDTPPSNLAQRQITAAHVLHAMREAETISYTDLASQMIDNVREALAPSKTDTQDALRPEEERSLRRHIYDVVNVLIAMGLVEKDQNMLTWTAVPQSTEREFVMLDKERRDVLGRIADKQAQLRELMLQTSALHNLAQRNKKRDQGRADASKQVALPFVVVTTDKNAVIECEMAESRNDIVLNMSEPFKIHDDTEVLKRLKLHLSSHL